MSLSGRTKKIRIKFRFMKTKKLTPITKMHYAKLIYRSALFLAALVIYVFGKLKSSETANEGFFATYLILGIVWLVYAVEMLLRFFPSKLESPGCQKQFKRNYKPTGETKPYWHSWKRTFAAAAAWFALNGAIAALYFTKIIDAGILVLVSLAYGICDMICILFFCPFQTWFLKNRCCVDCRIYNWDFAMMFTPFVFLPHLYTWSLLAMSLAILIRWEVTLRVHPERFSARTNACISCQHCEEKLCRHKKQLKGFWQKNRERIFMKQPK